jgi:hypothetical protein
MTTMTLKRFEQIVEAYGADPRRWPDDERDAACAFAQTHPADARPRLAAAAALDAALDADVPLPVSRSLRRRIVASANRRDPWPFGWRFESRPARRWLPGAALAGAGVAGLVAGAVAMSLLMVGAEPPNPAHESAYLSTSFGFDASGAEGGIE